MSDDVVWRFHVEAYTPETMPMARLAEYLGELAKLLGQPNAVHFLRLEAGSTDMLARVEREAAPKALAQAEAVRIGKGPPDAVRAFHRLNQMLGDDNGSGSLTAEGGAQIIAFPGARRPVSEYATVSERGSIDGELIRIGGKKDPVHLTLQWGSIDYSGIEVSRAKAEELGKFLFRPIRLFGDGRWFRTADGEWLLDRFRVDSFDVLDAEPLPAALLRLRTAASGDWAKGGLEVLDDLRHGDAH